jgi:peroxiredoxin
MRILSGWAGGVCAAGVVAAAGVCGPAWADPDPTLKSKFEEAAAAVKKATAVTFKAKSGGKGGMMDQLCRAQAEVWMLRPEGEGSPWVIRATGQGSMTATETPPHFDLVWMPSRTRWVDDEAKTVFEAPGAGKGLGPSTASMVQPLELIGEPFTNELRAESYEAMPVATADGVACDVVRVEYKKGAMAATWYLGQSDHFPRKVDREPGPGLGVLSLEFNEVRLGADLTPAMLTIPVPPGYTEDKAPEAPKPEAVKPAITDAAAAATGAAVPLPASAAAPAHQVGANVGDTAPEWELTGADGQRVSLSSLRGNVVVLQFWGTWSLAAKRSSPEVQALSERFRERPVKVYGVACREPTDEKPVKHMQDNHYTYGLLLKGDEVARRYKVAVYPTIVVIGRDGEILYNTGSYKPQETFANVASIIEAHLGGAAKPAGEADAIKPKAGS